MPKHCAPKRDPLRILMAALAALTMRVNALGTNITTLITQGGTLMNTVKDLKDAITQVAADIVAEKGEVQTQIINLTTQIKALSDQIASGVAITQADLDALISSVQGIDAGVKDISEPAVPPVS